MIEVDRLMIEEYGISLLQMMEHAGENLAKLVRWFARGVDQPKVTVLCGNGHNGGGGFVCTRFLLNWGYDVKVITVGEDSRRKVVPEQHLKTLHKMGVEITSNQGNDLLDILKGTDVIVDAIIGYGLSGKLSSQLQAIIATVNQLPDKQIISLDAPTGLDVSGELAGESIVADGTLTLALPKHGLLQAEHGQEVGSLFLADIGVPRKLYSDMGLEVGDLFADSPILQRTEQGDFKDFIL
jgi:NAD(P)H-hydrate epimerase